MSLETALTAFQTQFNAEFDSAQWGVLDDKGIPDDALAGPFPGAYLEPADELPPDYAQLQGTFSTSQAALIYLLLIVHLDEMVAAGNTRSIRDELINRSGLIKTFCEERAGPAGAWAQAAGGGFLVKHAGAKYHSEPDQKTGAVRISLRFESYGDC